MNRIKKSLAVTVITVIMASVFLTSCAGVEKIEKQEKKEVQTSTTGEKGEQSNTSEEKGDKLNVSEMKFETKSIDEIRAGVENSMSVLGTDSSEYGNIAKADIVPIITDEDEIYNIKLERLDGNDLADGSRVADLLNSDMYVNSYEVYRNDKERVKTQLKLSGDDTDIESLIEFVENYMDTTYKDSLFKWVVEYITVYELSNKQNYVSVGIRPSYDGVVFTKNLVLNDGLPTRIASEFRGGTISIISKDSIYGYSGICPYYNIEKQGEAISEILSIECVLSIVANKIDKGNVNEIKVFELAYRLNKDLSAVPIWNIVVSENGVDRNFQIDAVTGDVYFE